MNVPVFPPHLLLMVQPRCTERPKLRVPGIVEALLLTANPLVPLLLGLGLLGLPPLIVAPNFLSLALGDLVQMEPLVRSRYHLDDRVVLGSKERVGHATLFAFALGLGRWEVVDRNLRLGLGLFWVVLIIVVVEVVDIHVLARCLNDHLGLDRVGPRHHNIPSITLELTSHDVVGVLVGVEARWWPWILEALVDFLIEPVVDFIAPLPWLIERLRDLGTGPRQSWHHGLSLLERDLVPLARAQLGLVERLDVVSEVVEGV